MESNILSHKGHMIFLQGSCGLWALGKKRTVNWRGAIPRSRQLGKKGATKRGGQSRDVRPTSLPIAGRNEKKEGRG